ncbi:putative membrane protein [Rickettsia amblyommatis str. Darkwater]|nr:putative membrane protein [Rickettsia amblyommatis str. Darkwater]
MEFKYSISGPLYSIIFFNVVLISTKDSLISLLNLSSLLLILLQLVEIFEVYLIYH